MGNRTHFLWFVYHPRELLARLPTPVAACINYGVVCVLWVPFALHFEVVVRWLRGLGRFSLDTIARQGLCYGSTLNINDAFVVLIGMAIVLLAPNARQIHRSKHYWPYRLILATSLVVTMSIILSGAQPPAPFIYFQF